MQIEAFPEQADRRFRTYSTDYRNLVMLSLLSARDRPLRARGHGSPSTYRQSLLGMLVRDDNLEAVSGSHLVQCILVFLNLVHIRNHSIHADLLRVVLMAELNKPNDWLF